MESFRVLVRASIFSVDQRTDIGLAVDVCLPPLSLAVHTIPRAAVIIMHQPPMHELCVLSTVFGSGTCLGPIDFDYAVTLRLFSIATGLAVATSISSVRPSVRLSVASRLAESEP